MSFSIRRFAIVVAISLAVAAFFALTTATVSGSPGRVSAQPAHSDGAIWG